MAKPCQACAERALNQRKVSRELRALRESSGVLAKSIAIDMEITGSYLCDLERGRRKWTPELVERYRQAITTASG